MTIDTIIFDVGGTLVDFPNLFEYFSGLYPVDQAEEIKAYLAHSVMTQYSAVGSEAKPFCTIQEMVEVALRGASRHLGVADLSESCREHLYHIGLDCTVPFADTIPLLSRLQKLGVRLLVASDADTPLLKLQLEKLGLSHFFADTFVSGDLQAYKPSDTFVSALRPKISSSKSALFVGDNDVDVLTGRKLGIRTVHKTSLPGNPYDADFVIAELDELDDIVGT
jgi:phosphoglycolate phosphatase-like HAD superfamily hydrolase